MRIAIVKKIYAPEYPQNNIIKVNIARSYVVELLKVDI